MAAPLSFVLHLHCDRMLEYHLRRPYLFDEAIGSSDFVDELRESSAFHAKSFNLERATHIFIFYFFSGKHRVLL